MGDFIYSATAEELLRSVHLEFKIYCETSGVTNLLTMILSLIPGVDKTSIERISSTTLLDVLYIQSWRLTAG